MSLNLAPPLRERMATVRAMQFNRSLVPPFKAAAIARAVRMGPLDLVRDFGAKNDPSYDNSAEIQAWLDSGANASVLGTAPEGIFMHTQEVFWTRGVFRGAGRFRTIFHCPSTTHPKFSNRNIVVLGDNNRVDGASFSHMGFTGDPDAPIGPGVGCIGVAGAASTTFQHVYFGGHRHFVLVLSNNLNFSLLDFVIDDWGVKEKYTGPLGGREAGTAVFGWQPNYNMIVRRGLLRNGSGGGMWFDTGGFGLAVSDIVVDEASEFGLVGAPQSSRIENVRSYHIRRDDVSGHGVEMQDDGHGDVTFTDNTAYNCDGAGFYFTDPHNWRIEGNRAEKCNQGDSKWAAMSGAYIFRTATTDQAAAGRNISFKRNSAIGLLSGKRPDYPASFVNFAGGNAVMSGIDGSENSFGSPAMWGMRKLIGAYPEGCIDAKSMASFSA